MSYNQDFFRQYKNYLQEPVVRKTHDTMFHYFKNVFPKEYKFLIADFGCGQCCEFLEFGESEGWFGFDLKPAFKNNTCACDYTKLTESKIKEFGLNIFGFVSIFSAECCLDKWEKYSFYRRMFRELPIQAALVSGFYYEDKIKEEQVKETDGILSYQSIEDQRDFICNEFVEWRTCVYVPSKMFGDRVVEVWKLLIKHG